MSKNDIKTKQNISPDPTRQEEEDNVSKSLLSVLSAMQENLRNQRTKTPDDDIVSLFGENGQYDFCS